jgi:predicted phosphodiesterase
MPNAATGGWDAISVDLFTTKTDAEIAAIVGKSENAVQKRRKRLIEAGSLLLDTNTEAVFQRLVEAQEDREMRASVAARDKEIVRLQRELDVAQRIDAGVRRPPKWTSVPTKKGGRVGIVTAQLTDTHFDEVVKPEEVGFINAYNREIAEKRFKRWVEKVIVLSRDFVSGVEIEGIFIPATGDLLSGDIHAELKESNEDVLYSSADHWIDQLIAGVKTFADEFGKVHVAAVVGNHGRSTLKPVFKNRPRSNIEWLMWRQVARYFEQDDRVTVQVSDSMDLTVAIYETNYLLTHGDQYKGGTGISGAMSPLMLGQHRKAVRQLAANDPIDIMVVGHFHQYITLPGLIMGGSMKGYDEYAYGHNLRPERAQQAFWVTSPEYGPTIHAPVHVENREDEGW